MNVFSCQSDDHNKLGPKTLEMPGVQIECKSCRCDRIDLRIRVNVFSCQSDAHNKLRPKTLNVHRYPC